MFVVHSFSVRNTRKTTPYHSCPRCTRSTTGPTCSVFGRTRRGSADAAHAKAVNYKRQTRVYPNQHGRRTPHSVRVRPCAFRKRLESCASDGLAQNGAHLRPVAAADFGEYSMCQSGAIYAGYLSEKIEQKGAKTQSLTTDYTDFTDGYRNQNRDKCFAVNTLVLIRAIRVIRG